MSFLPLDSPTARWAQNAYYGIRNRLGMSARIDVPFEARVFIQVEPIAGNSLAYAVRESQQAGLCHGFIVLDGFKLRLHGNDSPTGDHANFVRGILTHEALHLAQREPRHHGAEFEALCAKAAPAFVYRPPVSRHESRSTVGHPKSWPQGCGLPSFSVSRPRRLNRPTPVAANPVGHRAPDTMRAPLSLAACTTLASSCIALAHTFTDTTP